MEGGLLSELLLVIALAAAGVALFERARLPAIAGFLAIGALVGPGGLGLVDDPERVRALAELGVAFLLFEIGLELPIERVQRLWRVSFLAGALQVTATVALVAGVTTWLGAPWRSALVIGALVAMSSTALVLGLLAERGELDAPHGQLALGILLFQDLCVVPFLLAVPILAGGAGGGSVWGVALSVLRAAAALGLLALAARTVVPRILERAAESRSRDLFSLLALLLVVGSAVIAERIGLSLAVGAFIGGMVAASSPYAHQLFAEVLPLRGALIGLFFTAVGMLFDPHEAAAAAGGVAAYVAAVAVGKSLLVALLVVALLRRGVRTGLLAGIALGQTGEFSFVLAASASAAGLLPGAFQQVFVTGSLITLLLTPFLFRAAPAVVSRLADRLDQREGVDPETETGIRGLADHAVVIGYGVAGRNVTRVLGAVGVPSVVVEANPRAISGPSGGATRFVFGDATRAPLLARTGIARARLAVVVVNDPLATREIVSVARRLAPTARVLARTRYVRDLDALGAAGAEVIVAEELEGTVSMVAQVLRICGIAEGSVARFTRELREEGYEALRAPPGLALDPWLAELLVDLAPEWVEVPDAFPGEASLAELGVRTHTGATVLAVERDDVTESNPQPWHQLRAGDRLLALGPPAALERLRELLEARASGAGGHAPD
jgi:CPA2 family monovalent cation:H+ antiporter-2